MIDKYATGLVLWLCMTCAAWPQDVRNLEPAQQEQGTTSNPFQIQSGPLKPVPDPTEQTAKAIRELRAELAVLWDEKFANLVKQIDRILKVLDERPEDVKREVATLKDLMDEKFKGVAEQFAGRDNSLDIAFNAQKDKVAEQNASNKTASDKSENSFKDQIAALESKITAQTKTSDDKITDVKDRQTANETEVSTRIGAVEASLVARVQTIESESRGAGAAVNWIIAAVTVVATVIGTVIGVFAASRKAPEQKIQYIEVPVDGNGRKKVT
jgi:hypothetical protein